ncbi:MAG TPA: hypothetical protein VN231_13380 [Allosphingosinicella sp.]|nr:hypothetical protein [Allosphingosinicella sp.]
MAPRAALLLLLASVAAGCASMPAARERPARSARVGVDDVLSLAASQVRRCYRSPRVASAGRQIVTRLRVRFTADGQLAQLPVVVAQDGVNANNQPYAGRMAEAAIEAVLRCAPLRLPGGIPANRLLAFDLTFSPLAPA